MKIIFGTCCSTMVSDAISLAGYDFELKKETRYKNKRVWAEIEQEDGTVKLVNKGLQEVPYEVDMHFVSQDVDLNILFDKFKEVLGGEKFLAIRYDYINEALHIEEAYLDD